MKRSSTNQHNNARRLNMRNMSSDEKIADDFSSGHFSNDTIKSCAHDATSLKNLSARLDAAQNQEIPHTKVERPNSKLGAIRDKITDSIDGFFREKRNTRTGRTEYSEEGKHYSNVETGSLDRNENDFGELGNINAVEINSVAENKSRIRKPVIITAIVVALVIAIGIGVYAFLFGGMKRTKLDDSDLGINTDYLAGVDVEKLEGIVNIALFGIDTTDGAATIGDQYRSDCIIILSIDTRTNEFKVTSILRDSKVPIEGHDPQKINAAYKYGGAKLAIKTLNQNFKMNISDYVTVDFSRMAEIIDLVGGLKIKITQAEANNMMENNIIDPVKEGTWLLDGPQCVAYARVRKVDSDYFRASRQQHVLTLLFDKIKKMPKSDYPALIRSMMKCVETSMSYNDFIKILNSMDLIKAKIVTNTIPDPQYERGLTGGIDNTGSWVWEYNLEGAAARLHNIIYGLPYNPDDYGPTVSDIGNNTNQNNSEVSNQIDNFFSGGEVQTYAPEQEENEIVTEESSFTDETEMSEETTELVETDTVGEIEDVSEEPEEDPETEEPTTKETKPAEEEIVTTAETKEETTTAAPPVETEDIQPKTEETNAPDIGDSGEDSGGNVEEANQVNEVLEDIE